MTVVAGAKKVREGLVLSYDMYNEKSWRGRPTTNLVPDPLTMPASSWDARDNVTITYNELDPYGTRNAVRITPNSATDNYFGVRQDNLGVGTYSTSLWIKATKSTTMTLNTGNGGSASGRVREVVAIDTEWKYVSYTGNISVDGIHTLHVGGWSTWSDNSFDVFIAYPQVEFQPFATPFVVGERTNTQSVLDIAKTSTLTADPLTYSSDNTFQFGGLGELIEISPVTSLPTGTSDRTVTASVRTPTSFSQPYLHIIHWGTATTGNAFGMAVRASDSLLNTHTWAGAPGQGTLLPNTLYFLAVTYTHSDTRHRCWINGVSQGAGVVLSINTGTSQARIGCRIGPVLENWSPNGIIYDVSVYNRALTEEEIKQNYLAYRNRFGL